MSNEQFDDLVEMEKETTYEIEVPTPFGAAAASFEDRDDAVRYLMDELDGNAHLTKVEKTFYLTPEHAEKYRAFLAEQETEDEA